MNYEFFVASTLFGENSIFVNSLNLSILGYQTSVAVHSELSKTFFSIIPLAMA